MPATAAKMAPLCGVPLGGPDRKAWREAIALLREQQIGGSGGSFDPPGPLS
jgi:hypothetical protein